MPEEWRVLEMTIPRSTLVQPPEIWDDVVDVCRRIPPLWDLANYVAVNPFLGFAGEPLPHAAGTIAQTLGGQVLPPFEYYRARWAQGAFGADELEQAAQRIGLPVTQLQAVLAGDAPMPTRPATLATTFAEQYDRATGADWQARLVEHATLWCAAYVQEQGAQGGLFGFWRAAAPADRSLAIAGLAGWRQWAAALPHEPRAAIETALAPLALEPAQRAAYLYRLLAGVYGWASYLRRDGWRADDVAVGDLVDLLAIRVATDVAVKLLVAPAPNVQPQPPALLEDEHTRLALQEALEDGYVAKLAGSFQPAVARESRPLAQAIFCIDVRSEPFRRHLEAQNRQIETLGFAGFFGVALEWSAAGDASARCPVLLTPGFRVQGEASAGGAGTAALKHVQSAPAAAFNFVEVLGLAYGLALARDAAVAGSAHGSDDGREAFALAHESDEALAAQVDIAAGILSNTSLPQPYAPLVLLCGHEGQSANNPHAAGLDCGACGGHGGAINARVAAALLNDSAVRGGLRERGWVLPHDTWFVPAVHNTTLDDVQILDRERVPSSHHAALAQLEGWLAAAGAATRTERAPGLDLAGKEPRGLARLLRRRANDWSEARPEWALARNAAFIAARRGRTRGVNLAGRTFLHEYDSAADADSAVLGLILAAPVVVASWINLQYMASTVDNQFFGAGTKALHNRVGAHGVLLGNGGDLRTGLALQSVHAPDGSWYHEPLRLQVVIEAPREKLALALANTPHVRDLVENGWLRLFALDPDSHQLDRWAPGFGWQPLDGIELEGDVETLEVGAPVIV
jgi:uncharacterized protein